MTTIWKFTLHVKDRQFIKMPVGADILHVGDQHGVICLWALVDPKAEEEYVLFEIIGTGHEVTVGNENFIGTVIQGPYVWHIFKG